MNLTDFETALEHQIHEVRKVAAMAVIHAIASHLKDEGQRDAALAVLAGSWIPHTTMTGRPFCMAAVEELLAMLEKKGEPS